jgi:predicted nucleic acid-binding protein
VIFVLDTNALSELRRRDRAAPRVIAWAAGIIPSDLFLSIITVLEIEAGTLLLQRRDQAQAAMLRTWIDSKVMPSFAGCILPVDTAVAQRCAQLHMPDPRADRDALIAATALVHGFTVATRNTMAFQPMGVRLINPFL